MSPYVCVFPTSSITLKKKFDILQCFPNVTPHPPTSPMLLVVPIVPLCISIVLLMFEKYIYLFIYLF
jgi:hypothetical protein